MKVRGEVAYWLIRNGRVIQAERRKNLVVDGASEIMAGLVSGNMDWYSGIKAIAIGTNTAPSDPAPNQTSLVSEMFRRALPASGTNTALSANYIDTSGGGVRVVFRELLTPHNPSGAYGGTQNPSITTPVTINEMALFGNLIPLTNPTLTPTLATATTGGSIAADATGYRAKFTWINDSGETLVTTNQSNQVATTGSNSTLTVTIPTPIDPKAKKFRLYVQKAAGAFYLQGGDRTITQYTSPIVTVLTTHTNSGVDGASITNTTAAPGIINGGKMWNRVIIGPVTMSTNDRLMGESAIFFA